MPATRPSFHDMRMKSLSFPRRASPSLPYCTSHFGQGKFMRNERDTRRLVATLGVIPCCDLQLPGPSGRTAPTTTVSDTRYGWPGRLACPGRGATRGEG